MARKKRQEDAPNTGGWINTFADLMNLLLCFFVLLFSMSTVDADKYEQLVTSMTQKINIFDGGGAAVGEGAFVSSGTDQLVSISQYFNEFEESGDDSSENEEQKTQEQSNQKTNSAETIGEQASMKEVEQKVEAAKLQEQKEKTEQVYEQVVGAAQNKNIDDQITVNMDKAYQYVQISLNGAILFDSGTAQVKKNTKSLLSKVGDILKVYQSHMIKIEGHTDNVPISNSQYHNNMWLSTARATEVFEYLVQKKGLDPKKIEPTGRGEYEPIASNKTEKGRRQNRRVEIKIYTNE
ncbi:MAG: flagellar motor protein MotB [Eubacterium sp.]|nr:flagellar motor protein MotB [Eubacterium sp.]